MEWINVKKKKPELSKAVLVATDYGGITMATYSHPGLDKRRTPRWRTMDDGSIDEVTHWMPLPNPPKQ